MKHLFKCLFLLALTCLCETIAAQAPYVRKGLLDLSDWNFDEGSVNLTGEWEFYMSQLIAPEEFKDHAKTPVEYIDFPSLWNDYNKTLTPGEGFATYHLVVIVTSPRSLAFELPHFYSNYSLWVNAQPIASNGRVSDSKKTSTPQWLPQTIAFNATQDTLDIVIQVSNFHHAKGGVREPVLLGNSKDLRFKRQVARVSNIVLVSGLTAIAIAFLILFFFFTKNKPMLFFAALCLTWAVRSMFSNQYVATSFMPNFPWELSVKIEYITLYLMMIWAILFMSGLFKSDIGIGFKYLFCICNGIFIGLTLLFKASLYTQFLPVYLSFCTGLLISIIYILIRAIVYERQGVWFMVSSLFLGVVLFSYDLISYQSIATYNPLIINFGYMVMFLLMAICLLYQSGFLKRSVKNANMLTYADLYEQEEEKR